MKLLSWSHSILQQVRCTCTSLMGMLLLSTVADGTAAEALQAPGWAATPSPEHHTGYWGNHIAFDHRAKSSLRIESSLTAVWRSQFTTKTVLTQHACSYPIQDLHHILSWHVKRQRLQLHILRDMHLTRHL